MDEIAIRKIHKIEKKFGKALKKYEMLKPNDKIIVGISGGKDSLFLLENLALKKAQLPFPIDIFAVHINLKNIPYQADIQYLKQFAADLDTEFIFVEENPDFSTNTKSTPCFLCSMTRRKLLFEASQKIGANKIALGHHLDDALETLLMNMMFNGNISSMPGRLKYDKMPIELIRPMILLQESEIEYYAQIKNYRSLLQNCPHEDRTKREATKKIIKEMEKLNPFVRENLLRSMKKIDLDYLP